LIGNFQENGKNGRHRFNCQFQLPSDGLCVRRHGIVSDSLYGSRQATDSLCLNSSRQTAAPVTVGDDFNDFGAKFVNFVRASALISDQNSRLPLLTRIMLGPRRCS
jgi:hypothetical protein